MATTVITLPEVTESTVRAASAPPEKTSGSLDTSEGTSRSRLRVTPNRTNAPAVNKPGRNQKPETMPSQREPKRPESTLS